MPRASKSKSADSVTASTTTITGPGTGSCGSGRAWRTTNIAAAERERGPVDQLGLVDELEERARSGRRTSIVTPVSRLDLADDDRERDAGEEAGRIGRDRKVDEQPRARAAAPPR